MLLIFLLSYWKNNLISVKIGREEDSIVDCFYLIIVYCKYADPFKEGV